MCAVACGHAHTSKLAVPPPHNPRAWTRGWSKQIRPSAHGEQHLFLQLYHTPQHQPTTDRHTDRHNRHTHRIMHTHTLIEFAGLFFGELSSRARPVREFRFTFLARRSTPEVRSVNLICGWQTTRRDVFARLNEPRPHTERQKKDPKVKLHFTQWNVRAQHQHRPPAAA